MRLTWHIIMKDLRRDRLGLRLWALLFVAQVAIGFVLLGDTGDERGWIGNLQAASVLLAGLQLAMSYVLTARLVQADPLLGTDMFWVTRPISGRRLLLAKAGAVLVVFGLLPVLLRLPWWLACGFTARDIFWTAVNTAGWQLLVVAPAFLIAALTNEFSRVLLWSLLLFIAAMLGYGLLINLLQADRKAGEMMSDLMSDQAGTLYTQVWLSVVLAMLLAAVIVAHQYLTRHLLRSIGLTVAGLGVVLAAGYFTRADWSPALSGLIQPTPSPEIAAVLGAVKVEAGAGLPTVRGRPRAGQEPTIVTEVYFEGLPKDLSISTGLSRLTWRWPDGLRVRRTSNSGTGFLLAEPLLRRTYALVKPPADPETEAWFKARRAEFAERRQARGFPSPVQRKIAPPSRAGMRTLVHSTVPEALIKRVQMEPPAFEASLWCVATRPAIRAELPLRAGAQGGADSTRARLMWVGQREKHMAASILVTAPMLRESGLWLVNLLVPHRFSATPHGEVWTVNRTTGDLNRTGGYSLRGTRTAIVAGVILSWSQPLLEPGEVIRDGKRVPRDPAWLDHTSLVLVDEELVARFDTSVRSDRMEFRPSLWVESAEAEAAGMTD